MNGQPQTIKSLTVPKEGYVAFDAMSLRQLIIDRLNEQGTFTDQAYVGSNLASIIDIISYAYHTLIYYLNKTSTESMFTEAQLYENINRIVKLVDYSPVGFQTSTLSFTCTAQPTLTPNLYAIPRYSFLTTNGITFSINEDILFSKTLQGSEFLQELSEQKFLYQGRYEEYPLYTAVGEDYETITMNIDKNTLIDHYNIDVYVKPIFTGKWEHFTKTPNLYIENSSAKKYEIRLNENKRYEIKFGNNINGYRLNLGDQVAIYYIKSNGQKGLVGIEALNQFSVLLPYNTTQYNSIMLDILENRFNILTTAQLRQIIFSNLVNSTNIQEPENVEQIRRAAPGVYKSQFRVVTAQDYESFIKTNFVNLISDVRVINNFTYVEKYLKYFYDLGLNSLSEIQQPLFNQVQFADSCNFNNVYIIGLPRTSTQTLNFLNTAQKETIINALLPNKILTTETVFIDPVYKAISFGVPGETFSNPINDELQCILSITKERSSRRFNDSIKNDVINILKERFDLRKAQLGQTFNIQDLTQQILAIEGVQGIETIRTDESNIRVPGLSFYMWNPLYPTRDTKVITANVLSEVFEVLYLHNPINLTNKIQVITPQ